MALNSYLGKIIDMELGTSNGQMSMGAETEQSHRSIQFDLTH